MRQRIKTCWMRCWSSASLATGCKVICARCEALGKNCCGFERCMLVVVFRAVRRALKLHCGPGRICCREKYGCRYFPEERRRQVAVLMRIVAIPFAVQACRFYVSASRTGMNAAGATQYRSGAQLGVCFFAPALYVSSGYLVGFTRP